MNLHSEIFNIPCHVSKVATASQSMAYRIGHRNARHAAAELALGADAKIKELEDLCRKLATLLKCAPLDAMGDSPYAREIRDALAEAEGLIGEVVG